MKHFSLLFSVKYWVRWAFLDSICLCCTKLSFRVLQLVATSNWGLWVTAAIVSTIFNEMCCKTQDFLRSLDIIYSFQNPLENRPSLDAYYLWIMKIRSLKVLIIWTVEASHEVVGSVPAGCGSFCLSTQQFLSFFQMSFTAALNQNHIC